VTVEIGATLTIADVVAVAAVGARVTVAPQSRLAVLASRRFVERLVADGAQVYGITTGVGRFSTVRISPADAATLQANIVRSHAAGVGPALATESVRAMMVLRAHGLALGVSGVRPEVIDLLVECLNRGIHPVVPEQGSVGASGDLAPLAHLALALIGEGEVVVDGRRGRSGAALAAAGLAPLRLSAKEGVALVNGTQLMTGIGALAVHRARRVCALADVAGAMTLEALRGQSAAFHPRLHQARPHRGQQAAAANIVRLTHDSVLIDATPDRVQDAYSLRCLPQVHGAVKDAVAQCGGVIEVELNAVTDNPLLFPDDELVLSGGNFHGQPVALALDYLAVAMAGLGGMIERRVERLLNPALSGLPAFLARDGGLQAGLMLAQYTAAALASENKVLAHPASVDSIPTSANQEDHVSMGAAAARKAALVVGNLEQLVGIELLCAAQALEFRAGARLGRGTAAAYGAVRNAIPPLGDDRPLAPDLAAAAALVREGGMLKAVESAVGVLQ
jgi:histidine ammonia-lyase